jgi:hypothetical protein
MTSQDDKKLVIYTCHLILSVYLNVEVYKEVDMYDIYEEDSVEHCANQLDAQAGELNTYHAM